METIKILITGACGVTPRAIARSIRQSKIFGDKCELIGTDCGGLIYGAFEGLYDKVYLVPRCSAPDYREVMEKIIADNGIEYAFVSPELEVPYWSDHPFDSVKYMKLPSGFVHAVNSKRKVYENLEGTGLVPKYQVLDVNIILNNPSALSLPYPMWIRDYAEGTSSGKGAYLAKDYEHLRAWVLINEHIDTFMMSEYLPGRNLACFLSYSNGELLQYGVAQRIEYILGRTAVSGITGNISYGRFLNDENVVNTAVQAVNKILKKTGEVMNGLVMVDLKEDADGEPLLTEINIRQGAFNSLFADAGMNFSEGQLLMMMGKTDQLAVKGTMRFPKNNAMYRDVDGVPQYVENYRLPEIGEIFNR